MMADVWFLLAMIAGAQLHRPGDPRREFAVRALTRLAELTPAAPLIVRTGDPLYPAAARLAGERGGRLSAAQRGALKFARETIEENVERGRIIAAMDDALIAAEDGRRVDLERLRSLPPWRAVLLARVLVKVTPPVLTHAELAELEADAKRVGGDGTLPGGRP